MQLVNCLVPQWAPLAWLARARASQSVPVELFHGNGVEIRPQWFAEAAWDGDFSLGQFDQTDIIVGSGARINGSTVTFVSAGNSLERLHLFRDSWGLRVSNSLPCLLADMGATLRVSYPHYHRDIRSICRGLNHYCRQLPTTAGNVEIIYFSNCEWDGVKLRIVSKPSPKRDFSCFESYRDFLTSCIEKLAANASDSARKFQFQPIGTLSGGYDSPTIAALAQGVPCRQALHFTSSEIKADWSATRIAQQLDIELTTIDLEAWQKELKPEVEFIAGSPDGEEVRFAAARSYLRNTMLLTGTYGDNVWTPTTRVAAEPLERMFSMQGLSLCEVRLWYGFLHVAPAYFGAHQVADIAALNDHPSMQPWVVDSDYSRPICRRIVESAGVQREDFGQFKAGSSSNLQQRRHFLTAPSQNAYYQWLQNQRWLWLKDWRIPPIISPVADALTFRAMQQVHRLMAITPHLWRYQITPTRLRRYVFQWAVSELVQRYQQARQNSATLVYDGTRHRIQ